MSPVFGGRVSQSEEYKSFRGNIPLKRITVADGKASCHSKTHNLLTFVSDQTWHVYDTGCGPSSVGSSPLLCLPPIAATADVFFRQCLGLWIKCFEYPYSELMSGVVSIVQSRLPRAVRVLAGVLDTRGLVPRPRPPPRPARPREGPHPRRGSRRLPCAEVCRDDAPLSAGSQPGALQHLHG